MKEIASFKRGDKEKVPLAIRWSAFNKINVRRKSNEYGVYELGNVSDILYIGEARAFARLMAHFANGSDPIPGASLYRVKYTGSKLRTLDSKKRIKFEPNEINFAKEFKIDVRVARAYL